MADIVISAMLDVLVPAIAESGIGIQGLIILVATGAHRGTH
jgi:hypothetical protein